MAVRLLKALFLAEFVESFQATPRNLTVLVYDRFGLDLPALSEQVKEALNLLEAQTYVQRKGNAYEYLTNEEQEIEEEVKGVDIDASEISTRLITEATAWISSLRRHRSFRIWVCTLQLLGLNGD